MSLTECITTSILRAATFSGRANRREFWCFTAFYVWLWLVGFAFALSVPLLALVFLMLGFAAVLPLVSVTVRRLHDVNRSALWLLLGVVPFIGSYALSVLLMLPGSAGPNAYGPEPEAEVGPEPSSGLVAA